MLYALFQPTKETDDTISGSWNSEPANFLSMIDHVL